MYKCYAHINNLFVYTNSIKSLLINLIITMNTKIMDLVTHILRTHTNECGIRKDVVFWMPHVLENVSPVPPNQHVVPQMVCEAS